MAQQIKKKFIQNDAVDSTKIKLLKDQAVRGQKQDGSEVELLKLDGSDKLVHDGQEIAFKSQVDAEASAREQGDQQVQDNLDSEASRLEGLISSEESSRMSEDSRIEGLLSSEEAARIAGDNSLQSSLDSEVSTRQSEISRVEGLLSDEESSRIAGDSDLQGKIDVEKGRIDAILLASEADKDSFAEIVQLINSVDTENDSAFASYVLSNNAALAQEISDREMSHQSLDEKINNEETRAREEEVRISDLLVNVCDGAGLDDLDGSYTPNPDAWIIDEAISLFNADQILDQAIMNTTSALASETSRAQGEESRIESKFDGMMASEEAARIAGDSAEQSRAMGVESSLQSQITQEVSDRQSAVSAEASARQSADTTLQSNIDAEETRAMGVEAELQSDLDNLDGYAQDIRSDLDQEILDRQSAVSAEETARIAGDSALQSSLNSEISARQSADSSLQSNIDSEQSARIAGDASTLQSSKDYTDGKISLVMSNLDTEALDSLVEVVSAFQNADSDLNQTISDLSAAATSALAAEQAARIAGDQTLQSNIDAEVLARDAAISVAVMAEQQARELFDGMLDAKIDQEVLDRQAGDQQLSDSISSTATSLMGTINAVNESLLQEISDREAADLLIRDQFASVMGVNLDQPYPPHEDANYIGETDNFWDADRILDQVIHSEGMSRLAADEALESRIEALEAQTDGPFFEKQKFMIDESSELSSIELSHECMENSLVVCVGRLMVHKDEDYSVSVVGGKSVLTWMGDFASGGVEAIEEGDVIFVTFARSV